MSKTGTTWESITCQGCLSISMQPLKGHITFAGTTWIVFIQNIAVRKRQALWLQQQQWSRQGQYAFWERKMIEIIRLSVTIQGSISAICRIWKHHKPVDEQYREKMNQMKQKGKILYTGKINTYILSGWWVHSKFVSGKVLDPLKMYHDRDSVWEFVKHIEDEVYWLHAPFPQEPMTQLTDVLKRKHKA